MHVKDKLRELALSQDSYLDQAKQATLAEITIALSQPLLQMLLVLIENIDSLEQNDLLELSEEEKAHVQELYNRANTAYKKYEDQVKQKDPYTSQVGYLSKKRHGK